jgi:hypothetical protein
MHSFIRASGSSADAVVPFTVLTMCNTTWKLWGTLHFAHTVYWNVLYDPHNEQASLS